MRKLAAFAFLLFCSLPLYAQAQPQDQDQAVTTLKANTRLVMLDVVVTDKDGNPIKGLTADDFRVLEKGKEQKISVFQGTGEQGKKKVEPLPPGVYSNRPWTQQSDQPAVILLIDVLNTPYNMIPLLKKDIFTYLAERKTHPNTAIFALGRSLTLLQDFTTDPLILQAAVRKYYGTPAEDRNEKPFEDALNNLLSHNPDLAGMLGKMIENAKKVDLEVGGAKEGERVQITTEAFRAIAAATAGIPQRKHLLWLSGSFPLIFGADVPDSIGSNRNFADYLRDSATKLADARISVFPVDAKRLLGASYIDASSNGRTMMAGGISTTPGTVPKGTDFANELGAADAQNFSQVASMEEIAQFTGGKVFTNRNELDKAIAEGAQGFPEYYTLGYYPNNNKWDGKFRKIEVKLNGKSYDLHYRKGYFATEPPESGLDQFRKDKDNQLRQAIRQPMNANEITFIARIQPGADPLTIDYLVDPDHIRLTPGEGDKTLLDMEFAAVAFAPDGKITKYNVVPARTTLTADVANNIRKQGVIFHVPLADLPAGNYRLRLVVRDNQTGMIGSLDMPTTVAAKPEKASK
jgi:VWFA-related protein